jgi:hypothetical protein
MEQSVCQVPAQRRRRNDGSSVGSRQELAFDVEEFTVQEPQQQQATRQ